MLSLWAGVTGCDEEAPTPTPATATASATVAIPTPSASESAVVVVPEPRCPPEMVKVTPPEDGSGGGRPSQPYCVDRYEAMLVDAETSQRISPYYAPNRKMARRDAKIWETKRFELGGPQSQAIPLPLLPAWELQRDFEPRAISRRGVTPNGHTSGAQAKVACANAGKRLCTWGEWRMACGGEQQRQFPYGDEYQHGRCNVFREAHPAGVLHDDPSIGHSDPRLNRVRVKGKSLLRTTGSTKDCASHWGDDAIYDMVGNVDEWLADETGVFAGGFYARSSKTGCDWRATGHVFHYADYSTGVRCCADLPRRE